MNNVYTIGKPSTAEADVQVGEAWGKHFAGKNEAALEQFKGLASRYESHIDAHFGLALCLKTAGQKEAAAATFTKVKDLCVVELNRTPKPEEPERFNLMLRIIEQHLVTLRG
jgi:hypothetical protein